MMHYGHLQVSPPSPGISQAVGQTVVLLAFILACVDYIPLHSNHGSICSMIICVHQARGWKNLSLKGTMCIYIYIYTYLYYVMKIRFLIEQILKIRLIAAITPMDYYKSPQQFAGISRQFHGELMVFVSHHPPVGSAPSQPSNLPKRWTSGFPPVELTTRRCPVSTDWKAMGKSRKCLL